MIELSLFKFHTCPPVTDISLILLSPPAPTSVLIFHLSAQVAVIKSDMQSSGVCYFTFVMLHLHTACPSSLQELEQCPLSIHRLHDMAYIQRTGGGY